jgi:hypothetical protein
VAPQPDALKVGELVENREEERKGRSGGAWHTVPPSGFLGRSKEALNIFLSFSLEFCCVPEAELSVGLG